MTTIAFDGRVLAADTRVTLGQLILVGNRIRKIMPVEIDNGTKRPFRYAYAFCGTLPLFPVAIQWHAAGADPTRTPIPWDDGSSLIVFDASNKGRIKVTEYNTFGRGHPINLTSPMAFGSGVDAALTTMRLGFDAVTAVEQAVELDTHSGLPLEAFDLYKWHWIKKARPAPPNAPDLLTAFKHGIKTRIIEATTPRAAHVTEAHDATEGAVHPAVASQKPERK